MSPAYRKVMTCKARRLKFFFEAPKFGNIKERFYARKHVFAYKTKAQSVKLQSKGFFAKNPTHLFCVKQ